MTGSQDIAAVQVWDVGPAGGAEWAVLPAPAGPAGAIAFTPDGANVAVGGADGSVALWDARTGRRTGTFAAPAAAAPALVTALAAGGGALTAAAGGTVRTWDAASGRERFAIPAPEGAAGLDWSASGERLALARGAEVLVTDGRGAPVGRHAGELGLVVSAVRFSPDGRLLATALLPAGLTRPAAAAGWISATRHRRRRAQPPRLGPGAGLLARRRADRRHAHVGPVQIWDAGGGSRPVTTLSGHTGNVTDVAIAPGGAALATASADGTVRLGDAATGIGAARFARPRRHRARHRVQPRRRRNSPRRALRGPCACGRWTSTTSPPSPGPG